MNAFRQGRKIAGNAKKFLVLAFLLSCAGFACDSSSEVRNLRLSKVGPFSVVIEWQTPEAERFSIRYGEGRLLDKAVEEPEAVREHRVVLTGLKPSTRYGYTLKGTGITRDFRSAPSMDGAFDLWLLDSGHPYCQGGELPESLPDIMLLAGPCMGKPAELADSLLVVTLPERGVQTLDFGAARFVLAREAAPALERAGETPDDIHHRIVVLPEKPESWDVKENVTLLTLRLARHGERSITWKPEETAWLEIDTYEISWVQGEGDARRRTVLVEAPPETRKSCLYCDRLLETGRYEESIAWYRRFLETNKNRHEVEDAAFAIARIYDEKLFRFAKALEEYERFLKNSPNSRRATLARYRIDTLKRFDDHDFKPLELFERAKASWDRERPQPALVKVEHLLQSYPDSPVIEEVLFWIGHLLEESDPERAKDYYRQLIERFPKGENAIMAAMATGDIAYRDKSYREAIAAYQNARGIASEKYFIAIDDKLRKSERNVWRETARYLSWAVLAFWLLATAFRCCRPAWKDVWMVGILTSGYMLLFGGYALLDLERARTLVGTLAILFGGGVGILLWNRALSRCGTFGPFVVVLHILTATLAAIYLTMYHFHYLYVFGV